MGHRWCGNGRGGLCVPACVHACAYTCAYEARMWSRGCLQGAGSDVRKTD